jgi:hypothetical protein
MHTKKNIYLLALIFIISFLINFNIFSKTAVNSNYKYAYPLSISLQFAVSPELYIYQPVSHYSGEFAFTFDTGVSFEYRFAKYFALDSGINVNTGYHYQELRVKRMYSSDIQSIKMNNVDLFFQYRLSMKVYFPNPIDIKNNYKLQFAFRFGFILDAWLMSYYYLTNNDRFTSKGQLFDNVADGPNAQGDYLTYGEYFDYSKIYNQINAGAHISFLMNFYHSKKFAISPEIGYIFYIVPFTDGKKNNMNITGFDSFLARNNGGEEDKLLLDFRMQIVVGVLISFSFGEWGSNLYDLAPKKAVKKK